MACDLAVLMLVKDEADIISYTIEHWVSQGADAIIIADNMSTDDTIQKINAAIETVGDECHIILTKDNEVGHYQSKKMTRLMHMAKKIVNPRWIIPCDADEMWYCTERVPISKYLNKLSSNQSVNQSVLKAEVYDHRPTDFDKENDNPYLKIIWRNNDKLTIGKVAFQFHEKYQIDDGNHLIIDEDGNGRIGDDSHLEIRHFPYRSFEQFKRKVINGKKAFDATNLPESCGTHWRAYGGIYEKHGEQGLRNWFEKWFYCKTTPELAHIIDPAPYLGVKRCV